MQENANRLKAYKTNLVLFPRRNKKPRAGDTPREEAEQVLQSRLVPSLLYCYPTNVCDLLAVDEVYLYADTFAAKLVFWQQYNRDSWA